MRESPDTIHGRMKEGAHLAGYGLSRAMDNLKWLLEEERYKQLAPGYSDVNEFLRDTRDAFQLLRIDPEERKQIAKLVKELQPQASQRAIADMTGVSKETVARDLGKRSGTNVPDEKENQGESDVGSGTNVPPEPPDTQPWTTDEGYDPTEQGKAKKKTVHVFHNSGENEWYTPPKYIKAAHATMGSIDCDPASSDRANEIVRAASYYTIDDDGLQQSWHGNVWMNPPYAQPLVAQFTQAVVEKFETGEIEQACVIVNNATETAWYQRMLAACSAVCLIKGRVKYLDRNGEPQNTPLQGQTVLYFGNRIRQFSAEFSQLGSVLYVSQE